MDGRLLFLAERYLPQASEQTARADARRARATCELLAREGTYVSYLGGVLVPVDQMCFALFGADSADHIKQLIARAEIPYEHIVQAVRVEQNER